VNAPARRLRKIGIVVQAFVAALLAFAPARGVAQPYPAKIIKLVVPFPAGGGADVLARFLTHHMEDDLQQTFVIQNQPGAGGAIAFEQVARAAPDGYTLIWTSAGFAVVAATIANLAYRPESDFTHIALIAQNPFVLVVNPKVPARSVAELAALAKAQPDSLNFAHNGGGTLSALAVELLQQRTAIKVGQVGYRGDNYSITDVIAGHVDAMFSNSPVSLPHVAEGRLRGLAVTSPQRLASAPDLPTMIEAGVPGFEAVVWQGLSGPAGMPQPVVERLNASVRRALLAADVIAHFKELGAERVGSTPEAFDALVRRELAVWAAVAKRAGDHR
jgi:tripartite-type tricarboxylate transporter receptor subunit TctC